MSELTLTVIRLGLLALLWIFVFSVVGVLRGDLYGTRVVSRSAKKSGRGDSRGLNPATPPQPMKVPEPKLPRGAAKRIPTSLTVTEGPLAGTSLPLKASGVLLGRNPECTLVLDDDYASGRHARIYQRPEALVRRGPRLDQRHLPGQRAGSPTRPSSRSGRRCASARPSSSCGGRPDGDRPALRRPLRRRASASRAATRTPPTPGRTCSSSPTAWAATPPATSPAPSRSGELVHLDGESHGGDDALRAAGRQPARGQPGSARRRGGQRRARTAWAPP